MATTKNTLREMPDPSALGFEWPEWQAALTEYRRLQRQRTDAMAEQGELRRLRQDAEREDTDAHIKAIRAGKADPGTPKEDAVKRKQEAMERTVRALDGAVLAAERDLLAAVENARTQALAEAEQAAEQRRMTLQDAVDAWVEARTRYSESLALVGYLKEFPEGRFRVNGYMRNVPGGGLFGATPETPQFATVAEQLRRDAEPLPEPKERPSNPLMPTLREMPAMGPTLRG
jgi:hypothetical protein